MTRVRLGVLSFAHYHANFWSGAFRDHPRADLVGIWDDDTARGNEAATRFGTRFEPDLDALLNAVDAVAICSETARHYPLIERSAAKGCHVLCEKPIAATLEEADAIARAIAASGVVFMQSFPKRFDPVNHELKRLVDTGALGRIWLVRIRHGHRYGTNREFLDGWWTKPELSGGGTLIDEGVHGADFLAWLFGVPDSVQATISNALLGLAVEDTAIAVFRWADGLVAELAAGWMFQAADTSVEIYGSEGSALLSGVDIASRDVVGNGPYLRVMTAAEGERRWTVPPITPRFVLGQFHEQNALAFVESLVENHPPPISLADGCRALAMILAAYASARSGASVRLADLAMKKLA